MMRSTLLGLVTLLSLLTAKPVVAKVKFKTSPIPLTTTAGKFFEVSLPSLLDPSVTPSGKLKWGTGPTKPTWLSLDATNEKLVGTPALSDVGTKNFNLNVGDADSGDIAQVQLTVEVPIDPPKWKVADIDLGIQNEDKPWTFDLKPFVTNDPNGGPMLFSVNDKLPNWITLDRATGVLSGTPKRADVGSYSGIVFTATNKGGASTVNAHGKVLKTIKPPKWTQNPISLPDAFEDSAYTRDLSGFTSNPEGTPLLYSISAHTPPTWLTIGQGTGTLTGTPKVPGNVELTVKLRTTIDGQNFEDSTVVRLKVIHVNHPPKWLADPIQLPNAFTKVGYSQDLSKSATDPDGDKLTFKIESGPAWAKLDPATGLLSGTPEKTDLGPSSWVVSATDPSGLSAKTTVVLTVIKSNEPPVWLAKPTLLPEAREDFAYQADLTQYAKDPDNDKMFFTKIDGPAWITITASGQLSGTPAAANVGLQKLNVRVSDNISSPADVTEIQFFVTNTNHAPAWVLNPIRLTAKEDQPFSASIVQWVKDPDNDTPLTFSAISGNPWAQLSPTGTFTGTPTAQNLGENSYVVRVMDPGGLTADVTVIITVQHVNHKPYWTQDPIVLPNGKEESPYIGSVTAFAKDPDNDPLRFMKISGAPWVTVDGNGNISGTPMDPGEYSFQVRVLDTSNEFAVVTVKVLIEKINHPPRWRQNPIVMVNGYEDTSYQFDLAPYAVDDDGDAITFKMITGPNWLAVGSDGKITGMPTAQDVGVFEATFEVSDGSLSAQAKGGAEIFHKNHPPTIDPNLAEFVVKERETTVLDLNPFIKDSDGDKLNCSLIDNSQWLQLGQDCKAKASPVFKHIGSYAFNFRVDDGNASTTGILKIKVVRNPRPPIWLEKPITIKAKTNEPFSFDISTKASDLDGLKLSFSLQNPPAWISLTQAGKVSGTATDTQLGSHTLTVTVCNTDPSCVDNQLIVIVEPGTAIDTVVIDEAVVGAPAEHLWVIDNSTYCNQTISDLKYYSKVFFDELTKAKLHHTGMLISSDAAKFQGFPIYPKGGNPIFSDALGTVAQLTAEFSKRVDMAYSFDPCSNCNNSPIFSMHQLYFKQLQSSKLVDTFHKTYQMPQIPNDVMIVTHQTDHYKYYTANIPSLKNYTPTDYANAFIDFHNTDWKAYRINAIAPECPTLLETSGSSTYSAPSNAYRVLVDKTKGKYYASGCSLNMSAVMKEYAQKIIQRAYIHAKSRIKLSKTPMSVASLKVTLNGVVLPGNTSTTSDLWQYDATTNEVVVFWHKIDESKLPKGAKLSVEYRIS